MNPDSAHDPRGSNQRRLAILDAILKAISHPLRRHILLVLHIRGDAMTAGDIASRYSCRWPTVARHLAILKRAGLVEVQRVGRNQIYTLRKERLKHVLENWFAHFDL
jgi:DNA-binding transcriptional ArsR family regulator